MLAWGLNKYDVLGLGKPKLRKKYKKDSQDSKTSELLEEANTKHPWWDKLSNQATRIPTSKYEVEFIIRIKKIQKILIH